MELYSKRTNKPIGIRLLFTRNGTKNYPDENFRIMMETLSRIGVPGSGKKLIQSCHVLRKKDKDTGEFNYYLIHFKELFELDGRRSTMTEDDIKRRNLIYALLVEWGLIENTFVSDLDELPKLSLNQIKIVPYNQKDEWTFEQKYNIGKK